MHPLFSVFGQCDFSFSIGLFQHHIDVTKIPVMHVWPIKGSILFSIVSAKNLLSQLFSCTVCCAPSHWNKKLILIRIKRNFPSLSTFHLKIRILITNLAEQLHLTLVNAVKIKLYGVPSYNLMSAPAPNVVTHPKKTWDKTKEFFPSTCVLKNNMFTHFQCFRPGYDIRLFDGTNPDLTKKNDVKNWLWFVIAVSGW